MIGRAVVVILLVAVLVAGVSAYLSPDDLADCSGVSEGERGSCSAAGAIVVISGGDTQARTSEAITLFNDGWAPLIIFSGAAADKDGPSNAAVMRQQAVEAGVPVSATIIEDLSETTKQNAEQVREHLHANDIDDIILVTSGYHMRRAGLEFERELSDTITLRRHPVEADNQWSRLWWLTPWGWGLAGGELVRIIAFYVGSSR